EVPARGRAQASVVFPAVAVRRATRASLTPASLGPGSRTRCNPLPPLWQLFAAMRGARTTCLSADRAKTLAALRRLRRGLSLAWQLHRPPRTNNNEIRKDEIATIRTARAGARVSRPAQ